MLAGLVEAEARGRTWTLQLTIAGIATLQAEYGRDLAGLFDDGHALPDFAILLRVIEVALRKHHPDDASKELADDLLTGNVGLWVKLLAASFPTADADADPRTAAA